MSPFTDAIRAILDLEGQLVEEDYDSLDEIVVGSNAFIHQLLDHIDSDTSSLVDALLDDEVSTEQDEDDREVGNDIERWMATHAIFDEAFGGKDYEDK
jgi:hypothetical protein